MRKKPIKELISPENLKINPKYALNTDDLDELKILGNGDTYKTLIFAFKYGYLQGCKATKKKNQKGKTYHE